MTRKTWFAKRRRVAMPTAQDELTHCSFCGRSQKEVSRLVAATDAAICDQCVDVCVDTIIEESERDRNLVLKRKQKHLTDRAACAICGVQAPGKKYLAVVDRGVLCPECVAAIRAALS
jgi:ATP-dependent protease Clp ATPase subunit